MITENLIKILVLQHPPGLLVKLKTLPLGFLVKLGSLASW